MPDLTKQSKDKFKRELEMADPDEYARRYGPKAQPPQADEARQPGLGFLPKKPRERR